jgi:hypothetical protein
MELLPIFDDVFSANKDLISHYTNSKAAIENILEDGMLKIGKKINTDDPIENKIYNFEAIVSDKNQIPMYEKWKPQVEKFLRSAKLICFCKNIEPKKEDDLFTFHKGYIRPRMWSQYGEHHKGICLVFSKKELTKLIIARKFPDYYIFKKEVEYTNKVSLQRSVYTFRQNHFSANPIDFIKHNKSIYFFSKIKDYRDESEFRIVLINKELNKNNDDVFFPYENSLKSIICGEQFHNAYVPAIREIAIKKNIPAYKMVWDYGIPKFNELN